MDKIKEMLTGTAGSIVGAIVILIVGLIVIKYVMKVLRKLKGFEKLDQTTTRFILNLIKWVLYVMLIARLPEKRACSFPACCIPSCSAGSIGIPPSGPW